MSAYEKLDKFLKKHLMDEALEKAWKLVDKYAFSQSINEKTKGIEELSIHKTDTYLSVKVKKDGLAVEIDPGNVDIDGALDVAVQKLLWIQ